MVGDWSVPRWMSWVALVVAAYLAFEAIQVVRKPV